LKAKKKRNFERSKNMSCDRQGNFKELSFNFSEDIMEEKRQCDNILIAESTKKPINKASYIQQNYLPKMR
jgi:hypothetical protein